MQQRIISLLNRLVEHYGHQDWWEDDNWLKDCVSMILIQQSTQENVEKALDNLSPHLTLQGLKQLETEELEQLIRPSGFFKQKSRYVQNIVEFFLANDGGLDGFAALSTEDLRRRLLAVKGIGPETADVMLLYLFQRKVFIADTYAIRLFRRLGLGDYRSYQAMKKDCDPLVRHVSLKRCKEWHACIDMHGKTLRKQPQTDESFLLD